MEKSTVLRKALWANVIFAELSAVAFLFLARTFPIVNELAGGRPVLVGIELLALAGLATYAALRLAQSRRLVQVIVALNVLLFGYYVELLLWGPAVSALATEFLLLDAVVVAGLAIAQIVGLRAVFSKKPVAARTSLKTVAPQTY
ncbi:hypothetical protein GCM10027299_32080 [Larkinella ripae]